MSEDAPIENEAVTEEVNPLAMSDEDMANYMPPEPTPEIEPESKDEDTSTEEDETELDSAEDTNDAEDADTKVEGEVKDPEDDVADKVKETDNEESSITSDAQLKQLFTPFKANGKMMQVDNVEEAISLMKMGAGFNKKMAGLKPNLKLMRMLENNNLLDEAKLSYLIDLDKKNPDAVKKFITESGVDPLTVNPNEPVDYKSNSYTVDDKEVELDSVLDEIKESTSYNNTIDIITNKWDDGSKKVILENPSIIKVINGHVELGIYDKINNIVEKERMLGRLDGLSDLEAYKQVGDGIQANGGFDEKPSAPTKATEVIKPTNPLDAKIRDRKKAASLTKSAPSNSKATDDFNPLALSDEEFLKSASNKYM